jgi:hypothetical protein
MSCFKISEGKAHQHGHWKAARSRVTHHAGAPPDIEPEYHHIGIAAPCTSGAREDVITSMPPSYLSTMLDVATAHLSGVLSIASTVQEGSRR